MMCKVLIFSCISAVMLMTAADGAALSAEVQRGLRALIEDLKLLENIKDNIHVDLYTPNEKEECTGRSLQCYLTEMSTLENEIEHEKVDVVQNIKKNLQNLTVLIPVKAGCKICEANKKNKFPAFHRELSNLLQSILK
ncbi:hypothetical protein N311_01229 [Apaloderma vittatum]|uniref:Interleukin n=1 Tax=Apaloderma vittatum TaxID=57397 RepID=A0A091NB88_APAVI|nr:hypothetical protein N311_01229 [Apaloderma vittatum]